MSYRTPDGFTLHASEVRAGNVEIAFPAKPEASVREELKAAGFRWSSFSARWYGSASKLPARYGSTPMDEAPDCHLCGGAGIYDPDHGTRVNTGPPCPACSEDNAARKEWDAAVYVRDPGEDASDRWNEANG